MRVTAIAVQLPLGLTNTYHRKKSKGAFFSFYFKLIGEKKKKSVREFLLGHSHYQ